MNELFLLRRKISEGVGSEETEGQNGSQRREVRKEKRCCEVCPGQRKPSAVSYQREEGSRPLTALARGAGAGAGMLGWDSVDHANLSMDEGVTDRLDWSSLVDAGRCWLFLECCP